MTLDSRDILVVDDDENFREALSFALEQVGYPVRQAGNGLQALAQLEEAIPGLILLDLRMPVMNGFEFLKALQEMSLPRRVPVLIVSSYGFEWEAELVEADGFIGKPVDAAQLFARIEALLPSASTLRIH